MPRRASVGIGPSVRLTADVHDVETGRTLGRASIEGSPDSVLTLVDRLSIEVIRSIMGGSEGGPHSFNLASITTASVPALKAFLAGEAVYRQAHYDAAIDAFERAVQLDSTFALAYYRLADAYGWKEYTNHPAGRPEPAAGLGAGRSTARAPGAAGSRRRGERYV